MYGMLVWIRWSKPKLSAADEQELAAMIRGTGVWPFIASFVGLNSARRGIQARSFVEVHRSGFIFLIITVVGLVGFFPAAVLGLLGLVVFYVSMLVAAGRYGFWLQGLSRRHPVHRVETSSNQTRVTEVIATQPAATSTWGDGKYYFELEQILSGRFEFTHGEQFFIDEVLNQFAARNGPMYVSREARKQFVTLGLDNYARTMLSEVDARVEARSGLAKVNESLAKILFAYAKAYAVSGVPIFLFDVAHTLEALTNGTKYQDFYQRFVKEQERFTADSISKPLVLLLDRDVDAMLHNARLRKD